MFSFFSRKSFSASCRSAFFSSAPLLAKKPDSIVEEMLRNDQHRASLVFDPQTNSIKPSHPMFQDLADYLIKDKRDFNKHEGLFFYVGPRTKALHSATIHNTTRGPGAGGVRYWHYDTFLGFVQDGLRLSQGMGRKNSLAGLWWGGGKGGIARQPDENWKNRTFRDTIFQEYGDFMTSLGGPYVTAEDLGVITEDMEKIHSRTRFTTCAPEDVGGSGNPSIATGLGVVCGMEGALDFLGKGTIQGKKISVQGAGNVSRYMIQRLLERDAGLIIASDVNPAALEESEKLFRGAPVELREVSGDDHSILYEDVDIVSPCALGGTLNAETIPNIVAPIICGAANNQLLDDKADDLQLSKKGITYVPDFLANRMGIVNCSNEQYGYVENDPAIQRHFGREWDNAIYVMTKKVLQLSVDEGITTSTAANKIADKLMCEDHPLWPNRSREIIQSLVSTQWHTKKNN